MFWSYTRIDFTWRANGSALEGWKKEDSEDEGGQLGASRPENRGVRREGQISLHFWAGCSAMEMLYFLAVRLDSLQITSVFPLVSEQLPVFFAISLRILTCASRPICCWYQEKGWHCFLRIWLPGRSIFPLITQLTSAVQI